MVKIDMADLDRNLIADLGNDGEGYEAFEAPYDGATVSNQCWHIVYSTTDQRGGIVFVGSGSSGATEWSDASSAADVLARYMSDDMVR